MGINTKDTSIWAMKYESKLTDRNTHVRAYFEQLDTIMKREDLRNIALTGNRGSGKSSILHSYDNYKNKGRGERFLYISLAEFEYNKGVKKKNEKETVQRKLEYSMLSQILSRCTQKDLRNSALRAIPEVREAHRWRWFKWIYAFILFTLICGLMLEKQVSALLQLGNWTEMEPELRAIGYSVAVVMMFIAVSYLISRKPGAFRLGKLSFKANNVETEIVPSENVFCLDQYRFELVYILNQIASKIDYTVVIEDLEFVHGCCEEEIVSKLQELNLLINTHRLEQYRNGENRLLRFVIGCRNRIWGRIHQGKRKNKRNQVENQQYREATGYDDQNKLHKLESWAWWYPWKGKDCAKPVRFIYALSEETFEEEKRTKFFDTILPVTPALNITNSYEIFKNLFTGKPGMSELPAYIMADKISRVVTDYRLLNDIRTEYEFFSKWHWMNQKRKQDQEMETEGSAQSDRQKKCVFWDLFGKLLPPWQQSGEHTTSEKNKEDDEEKKKIREKEQKRIQEKHEIERKLIAIAVYKALLPYEFQYAFTRQGKGMLINPKEERWNNKSYKRRYEPETEELIDFLFEAGHLDMNSLVLIGYSREVLRQQWEDILTNGTEEAREDFLNRFSPKNEGDEREYTQGCDAVSEDVDKHPENYTDIKTIERIAKIIFDSAEDVLKTYYSRLFDNRLRLEGFLNLLICLGSFEDEELKKAIAKVFSVEGEPNSAENKVKSDYLEKLKKDYQKRQDQIIKKIEDTSKRNGNLNKKYEHVKNVIFILYEAGETQPAV